jgi:hypothetical protein
MPDWNRLVRERLPALHVRPERESEIVAELGLQLEQAHADAVAGGADAEEALRRALAHLGDWEKLGRGIDVSERRAGFTAGGLHDLRYALRFFRRNPAFSAIATLTLGFGIGGNTAIFTMVDALVLRGLPYPAPDRLMAIETRKAQQPEIAPWTSAPDFFDFREQSRAFSTMAAIMWADTAGCRPRWYRRRWRRPWCCWWAPDCWCAAFCCCSTSIRGSTRTT